MGTRCAECGRQRSQVTYSYVIKRVEAMLTCMLVYHKSFHSTRVETRAQLLLIQHSRPRDNILHCQCCSRASLHSPKPTHICSVRPAVSILSIRSRSISIVKNCNYNNNHRSSSCPSTTAAAVAMASSASLCRV